MRRLAFVCIALGLWACSPAPAPSTSASPSQVEAATCAEPCPSASSTSGAFKLELALPKVEWKSDEPLSGTATLSYGGPNPTKIYGSGGLIGFRFTQIDGSHKVEPVSTADCRRYEIDPATPINAPLSKSGATSPEDPDFDFLQTFLTAPDVHLPAGTWDVTALANFDEGDCGPGGHSIAATVRVTVTD
jgi:hypothetical protein